MNTIIAFFWIQKTHTVIRFVWVSSKFGTCNVVSVNGTLVEDKMCTFALESTHFIFIKSPIYTHDGASAKFSTNSQEMVYSARTWIGIRQARSGNPVLV
jgi:hypothetical protein